VARNPRDVADHLGVDHQALRVTEVIRVVQVGRVVGADRVRAQVYDPLVEQPHARLAIQTRVLGHEPEWFFP
jgi:hypothetical protein